MGSISPCWSELSDEIALWQDGGRVVDFWWRDDDACRADAALDRLVALSASANVPLALAVIPADVQPAVLAPGSALVSLLQHGVDHTSRAMAGEKKTEFPKHEAVPEALGRLRGALARIQGPCTLPVLVPPWNRLRSHELLAGLAGAGYRGLSRFGPRGDASEVPGVVQVNTHVDLIDWRGTRGFVGEVPALRAAVDHLQARRTGRADAREATGWLSHHLVHDAACWAFLEQLFERTHAMPAVVWRGADTLFPVGPVDRA